MPAPLNGRSQVAIVGAGPAGCAAATTLARAGLDVCVFDRARFPRPKTCGDAVSNGAIALLSEMGLRERVLGQPHAEVRRATVVFPGGATVTRDYPEPGYILPRLHFDEALRRGAQAAGARVFEGVDVRELTRGADGVIDGVAGAQLRWRADVVIAADGPSSLARRALGVGRAADSATAVSATAYARGVRWPEGPNTAVHLLEAELPGGYGWAFPEVDGCANIGVYQRRDDYKKGQHHLRAMFDAFLARHPDRFGAVQRVGPIHSWPLPIAPPDLPLTAPGLLLAGDAARLVDPLSGEGIWQAIFSGVEAAKTAAGAVAEGALSPRLRRRYERVIARRIGRPSLAKRAAQRMLDGMVTRGLHRVTPIRGVVDWAYAGGLLEITKRA